MPNVKSIFHERESILLLAPNIWYIVTLGLKELTRKMYNEWNPENCPCRICKKYVSNLGFITVMS